MTVARIYSVLPRHLHGPARHEQVQRDVFSRGMSCSAFLLVSFPPLILLNSLCPKGLVPKPEVQRETHEAAEHSGRPEARVFPRPEEDESAGREAGGRRAWALLLLWR